MSDINHLWGQDIFIDDQGDIATAYGTVELAQRLIRRFLTNPVALNNDGTVAIPPDYVFERLYGGGARRYVDSLVTSEILQAVRTRFLNECQLETEVASFPAPIVNVAQIPGGLTMNASVTLADGTIATIPQMDISS